MNLRARLLRLLEPGNSGAHGSRKLAFVDWLASPHGPQPSARLRSISLPSAGWVGVCLRRIIEGRFEFPRPRQRLYVPSTSFAKIKALRRYARDFGLRTFVETGTFRGDTIAGVASYFEKCFTIELSPELHALAAARLANEPNAKCLHGDSASVLPSVLDEIDEPALFWLDAHASGGETADSGRDPILQELAAIYSHPIKRHVILIDDARGHDVDLILSRAPRDVSVSIRNDIIRVVPLR
jgi:hypothetical protein